MDGKVSIESTSHLAHAIRAANILREAAMAAEEAGHDHARMILNVTALHVEEEIAFIIFYHNERVAETDGEEGNKALRRFAEQKWEARKARGLVP
jgi:hypothetical protein